MALARSSSAGGSKTGVANRCRSIPPLRTTCRLSKHAPPDSAACKVQAELQRNPNRRVPNLRSQNSKMPTSSLLENRALDYFQNIVETVREPLVILDSDLRVQGDR